MTASWAGLTRAPCRPTVQIAPDAVRQVWETPKSSRSVSSDTVRHFLWVTDYHAPVR